MKMTTKKENRQSLCVRISPSRRAALDVVAQREEKSLTRVIEEAIDAYIMPKVRK